MRFMLHHNGVHQQCHRKICLCIEYLPKHWMMVPNLPPTPLTVLSCPNAEPNHNPVPVLNPRWHWRLDGGLVRDDHQLALFFQLILIIHKCKKLTSLKISIPPTPLTIQFTVANFSRLHAPVCQIPRLSAANFPHTIINFLRLPECDQMCHICHW